MARLTLALPLNPALNSSLFIHLYGLNILLMSDSTSPSTNSK